MLSLEEKNAQYCFFYFQIARKYNILIFSESPSLTYYEHMWIKIVGINWFL